MDEKPKFSEIIGSLVASIANARHVADAEALRIAHLYLQNELLKGLPVPRLRFRRVSISIPVIVTDFIAGKACKRNDPQRVADTVTKRAVEAVEALQKRVEATLAFKKAKSEEPPKSEPEQAKPEGGASAPSATPSSQGPEKSHCELAKLILDEIKAGWDENRFSTVLQENLQDRYLQLDLAQGGTPAPDAFIRDICGETTEKTIREVLDAMAKAQVRTRKRGPGAEGEGSDLQKETENFLNDPFVTEWIHAIRKAAEDAAIDTPSVPPDFRVSVDTDSIKNAGGGPDTVTRLNMVLLEEGLEWTSEVREGQETSKLMPE